MYIINGIAYAKDTIKKISVIDVKPLQDNIMIITFSNNEKRLYDASELLSMPAFAKLSEHDIFFNPIIEHGVITWDNGNIDIAPETLYANSYEYSCDNIIKI